VIKKVFAAHYLKKLPYAFATATLATCILYAIILVRPLPKYHLPLNKNEHTHPIMVISHNKHHQHPFPPETITEKHPQETLRSLEQKTIAQEQKIAPQKQVPINHAPLQKPIQQTPQQNPAIKPSEIAPKTLQQPTQPLPAHLKQRDIALLNATGKRLEQQPLGKKPDRVVTGVQRENGEQQSASEMHTNAETAQQPIAISNSEGKITEGMREESNNTAKNMHKNQSTRVSKTHTTAATRARKEGWFRDRRSAEHVQDTAAGNRDTNNNPVEKKIEWGKPNTMYGDSRGKSSTNISRELTIFGKPHDFYRSSLTYVNNDLDENLSILPCTMIAAEPLELEIFTSKVHQALARHLNQQQITVYSPQTTTVPISFDLVSQNNAIIAYVVTKSSGNANFDSVLAQVMNILAQAILPPQTDIASHAIAYPFTYSVHFLQGSHKYHVVQ
jgi:hypothetical protein